MMLMSMAMVKMKILKADDSKVMSLLLLYVFFPCVMLISFQVDLTPQVQNGLMLGTLAAVLIHVILIFMGNFMQRVLHLNAVEMCSAIYSNSGNLIIPLVTAVLGPEWVIYTSSFLVVQLVLFWTHMKSSLAGERHMDFKAVFTNANMIAIMIGFVLLLTGWRFPEPLNDAFRAMGQVVGPSAMIIAGILLGGVSLDKLKCYKRLPLVVLLRLVIIPLIIMLLLKYSGLKEMVENGETILLITLLATATPSATTTVSMATLFGNDGEYASVINVVTATLCVITMPIIVWLYQL